MPISIAYHIAHYLTDFLVNIQDVWVAISDPFERDWDLFGTAGYHVTTAMLNDYQSVRLIWNIEAAVIVLGHILAVALAHLYGAPGIVIDFGTAVTFDIVSADRHYIGGVIAPGLRLMTDYLHERTALLPLVELHYPPSVVGKSTVHAIQVGAAIGYQGMVRGLLDAIRKELGQTQSMSFQIVATGGDAAWIAAGLPEIQAVDDDLTLHGLRLVGNLHAR